MFILNDRGGYAGGNVSDTSAYCCNRPAAVALSALVKRSMMAKMMFVFLLSETLSK